MPKLSQYIVDHGQQHILSTQKQQKPHHHVEGAKDGGGGGGHLPVHPGQQKKHIIEDRQKQQQQQAPHAVPADQFNAAVQKLRASYSKRIQEHGPRCYRWPDGVLREEKPPPNPYAAANRQKWAQIVAYTRQQEFLKKDQPQAHTQATTAHALRYGIGVPRVQHEEYLAAADMEPETEGDDGMVVKGYDPTKTNPLEDPTHAFNSYFKKEADNVFAQNANRGRVL